MKYLGIFGLVGLLITVLIISWWAVKSFNTAAPANQAANQTEAIASAKALFLQKQSQGIDMSSGPCLSDQIINGWAADVAHNPREASDDLQQNQCGSIVNGTVQHFVELDTQGNLIRAQ